MSQRKFIFLATDEFSHWNHSHWNCILLLWKSTAFLSSKSYLPSFNNWNLIKSQTKQTLCISRKTPSVSEQSGPRPWWTRSDERWAQNKALYPNNPQLAWIIIITFMQSLMHMSSWERNPPFCMVQLSVLGVSTKVSWSNFYCAVLESCPGQPVTRCLLIESA